MIGEAATSFVGKGAPNVGLDEAAGPGDHSRHRYKPSDTGPGLGPKSRGQVDRGPEDEGMLLRKRGRFALLPCALTYRATSAGRQRESDDGVVPT
jgi:hypothetical protein